MKSTDTDCDPTDGGVIANDCTIASGLLPVDLITFKAKESNDKIVLSWETGSEVNNKGFELERSTDGRSFDMIAFIEGRGTSSKISAYSYEDRELTEGQVYYYRLKQIDFDGKFTNSEVVSVILQGDEPTVGAFYPNPSQGLTSIDTYSAEAGELSVKVYNLAGSLVQNYAYQSPKGLLKLDFDFSEFDSGLYIIKFENQTKTLIRKLSIQ